MIANRLSKNRLDENLRHALRAHAEPVPLDFTGKILSDIKKTEERKILSQTVLQERLALASCIFSTGTAILAIFALPDLIANIVDHGDLELVVFLS